MGFITRLRVAGTDRQVEAQVHPCGFEDMVVWHRRIHLPHIAPSGIIGSDWDWPAYFVGCNVLEQVAGRQAVAFQLRVANAQGDAVPVAQCILSLPYAFPGDARRRCVFVWLLAGTPVAALQAHGVTQRFAVLGPALDTAIQLSLGHGLQGRIGLHAASGRTPEETDALAVKYRQQGLQQRTRRGTFFRFPFRQDDGRLFYFDADAARTFAALHDDLR